MEQQIHPQAPLSPARRGMAELSLAVGGLALGIGEFAPMTTLPDIAQGMGASLPATGHMISAYALGVVVGAPLITILCAKVPRRAMLIGLMLALALANVVSSVACNLPTLLIARFLSGFPHGAYFGIAALVAASLTTAERRGRAVARVMLGLTVANVFGVPITTALSNLVGWRASFALIACLAASTTIGCALFVPRSPGGSATLRGELSVFGRLQVWLTLAVVGVGFGGLFALYTYITPTLTQITGLSQSALPFYFGLLGVGMTVGSLVGGWLADKSPTKTILGVLAWNATVLPLFSLSAHHPVTAAINLLAMGAGIAVVPAIQTRLMDVAGDAQTIAASLLHAAFNVANAIGAWAGGVVVSAGLGLEANGFVGTFLAAGGAIMLGIAVAQQQTPHCNVATESATS
ncbi:MFS transporter [Paraburkholderia bannensis]|uniref:MFS transporter n=1 Tax=Paraburkholderia bannensis TaxID=765414 RepID=UPI002AC3322B|nr:MFS transporter [Paraburkholderia bannensis]